jgi:hypothetical protein
VGLVAVVVMSPRDPHPSPLPGGEGVWLVRSSLTRLPLPLGEGWGEGPAKSSPLFERDSRRSEYRQQQALGIGQRVVVGETEHADALGG